MITKPNFQQSLNRGLAVESVVARFLRAQGFTIVPAYEKQQGSGKGPQVFTPEGELVAPDLQIMRDGKLMWVEVKDKSVFTWHRLSKRWMTGIDKRHHGDYCKIADIYQCHAYVFFFHQNPMPSASDLGHGCPTQCPTGLFRVDLNVAPEHVSDKWGSGGMVYWTTGTDGKLKRVASVESVLRSAKGYDK